MRNWKHNIIANIFGKASIVIFSFLFTPIYIKLLGIESYSLIAFFTSLVAMTYILDMTFGATMTREMAQVKFTASTPDQPRDLARSLECFYVFAGLAAATACYFSATWIATRWLKVEALPLHVVRDSIAMMGVCVGLQAPVTVYTGGLFGLERQTLSNMLSITLGLVRGLGGVAAIWFIAPTTTVFFGWQMIFGALQLGCFAVLFWRCMPPGTRRPRLSLSALRKVARFASGMAATGLVTFFLSQINSLLLSKLLPLSRLGIFQVANQVNTGARMLASPIDAAVLPRLAFHSGADDEVALGKTYHEASQFTALLVLPASTIIVFFPWGLINAWISNASIASQAAPVAAIMVIGSALNSLQRVPYSVTVAKGWSMFGFYQNLIGVIGFVPLLIFLAYTYGMIGVAYTWLILNVGYIVVSAPILHRHMLPGHFGRWMTEDILSPAVATCVFAFALRGVISEHLPRFPFIGAIMLGWIGSSLICAAVMPHTREIMFQISKRLAARLNHG